MQRGVRRRVHLLAASCLTETMRLAALALNRLGGASPLGRALVRGTPVGSARWFVRCHELAIRDPAPDFTARRLTCIRLPNAGSKPDKSCNLTPLSFSSENRPKQFYAREFPTANLVCRRKLGNKRPGLTPRRAAGAQVSRLHLPEPPSEETFPAFDEWDSGAVTLWVPS